MGKFIKSKIASIFSFRNFFEVCLLGYFEALYWEKNKYRGKGVREVGPLKLPNPHLHSLMHQPYRFAISIGSWLYVS
jgi:hypothetical protein